MKRHTKYSKECFSFGFNSLITRSGGNVVDNTLDYQSRDREIDPPLRRSFGRDFKPRSHLCMTSLLLGR